MKVVVTSRSFSENETLKKELLSHFPIVKFNIEGLSLEGEKLISFVGDADAWIVGLEKVDQSVLSRCKNLKIVSKYGVGLDNVNQDDCQKYGVKIGWKGGVNKLSVAEMTLGFMIGLSRNLYSSMVQHKGGVWNKNGGTQLSGKTVGIIGFGHIGKEVARLLNPFGCKVLINDIEDMSLYCNHQIQIASKDQIYRESDIISIHTPLTDTTRGIINSSTIGLMKPSAIIINTARGPLVAQDDLKEALMNNRIHAAAIDVYEDEPPSDIEFLNLLNLVCTPHIGGNSAEAVLAMGRSAIEQLVN
ncbi:MAG: phosphoglycerate dehydrogenase [Flavobacteriales bacterium]|nr:phosphoglycerate dehydrogenase [Flavobacteriales bacterium]